MIRRIGLSCLFLFFFVAKAHGVNCYDLFTEKVPVQNTMELARQARKDLEVYQIRMEQLLEDTLSIKSVGDLSLKEVVFILETFKSPVDVIFPEDFVKKLEEHFNYGLRRILKDPSDLKNEDMKLIALVTMDFYKMGYKPSLEFRELLLESVIPILMVLMQAEESDTFIFEFKLASANFLEPLVSTRKLMDSFYK